MLLKPGQSGEAVKMLQRGLNNLGSILLVDGDFGPATRDAVLDVRVVLDMPGGAEADDALQEAVASVPDPFLPLSAAGVTFIARAEVSGPREYRRKYQNPLWPSLESGITIGIGYDLQFVNDDQLRMDWGDHVSLAVITLLSQALGQRGSADQLASVSTVEIPLPAAMSVFMLRSLPRFLGQTRSIYPQIDELQPARRTALVSLVYNRGPRLIDKDLVRQERREMRVIRDLLAAADFEPIAEQFESMARLFDLSGLIKRRQDEAKLWRSGFAALQLI